MTTVQLARLVAVVAVLAGLDIAGTVALKEAALRREPALAVLGVGLFVALAGCLYIAIALADLTWVSLGWIIAVQVAVVVVDRLRYDVHLSPGQGAALSVAIAALVVACLLPSPPRVPPTGDDRVPQPRAAADDRQ
jgi:energy-converting hydrogenase Eha subunit C